MPTDSKKIYRFIVDAKPLWAALCQSLTLVDAEDYEDRRSPIFRISIGCDDLTMRDKQLNLLGMVARGGFEPPTFGL